MRKEQVFLPAGYLQMTFLGLKEYDISPSEVRALPLGIEVNLKLTF
jgi:hypothetical protein